MSCQLERKMQMHHICGNIFSLQIAVTYFLFRYLLVLSISSRVKLLLKWSQSNARGIITKIIRPPCRYDMYCQQYKYLLLKYPKAQFDLTEQGILKLTIRILYTP